MNHRQAKRIALAVNASYILFGADTSCVVDFLSEADAERYKKAQNEMAWDMLRRAKFENPMEGDEIVKIVMSGNADD